MTDRKRDRLTDEQRRVADDAQSNVNDLLDRADERAEKENGK